MEETKQNEETAVVDTTPPSREPEPIKKPIEGAPTQPTRNEDLVDTFGNPKTKEVDREGATVHEPITEPEKIGPRGEGAGQDVLTDADRNAMAEAAENKLRQNMASTDQVDSIGNAQGHFETTPGGLDKNGAKQPDTVHYDRPVEDAPAMVGPRGANAPKDTFHKR